MELFPAVIEPMMRTVKLRKGVACMNIPVEVYTLLSDPEQVSALEATTFPRIVSATFHRGLPPDEGWNCFFITDRADELLKRLHGNVDEQVESTYQRVKLVYIGDGEDIVAHFGEHYPQNLYGLWSPAFSPRTLQFYLSHVSRILVRVYYEWTYRRFLTETIDSMPELVWFKRRNGAHALVNRSFCRTVHKTREDILERDHYYIWNVKPDWTGVCVESEEETINAGHTCVIEEPVRTPDGMRHFLTYKTPLFGIDGDIWGTVGIAHDLTDYSNMGVEMNFIFESMPFPVVVCNADMVVSFVNTEFRKEFQLSEAQAGNFDYIPWVSETFGSEVALQRAQSADGEQFSLRVSLAVDGTRRYYTLIEQAVLDYFGSTIGYYCLFDNVTKSEEFKREILRHSYTDTLTGLHNRRFFMEQIRKHFDERLTLIFIDLDNFKSVNDVFGHAMGDNVLKQFAALLRETFPDALTSRFGGDEFAVLLRGDCSHEQAHQRMVELNKDFQANTKSLDLQLGVSFGITDNSGDKDIDAFLVRCDNLMYADKERHQRHFRVSRRD